MKDRIIVALIVLFLGLAVQDRFFKQDMWDFVVPTKSTISQNATNQKANEPIVTRVIDGDTIVVTTNGVSEKVRLIGVDTPETVDPRKPVQCFGKEASAFTKSFLDNKSVRLETDPSQGDRDKYGRLLRYVFLEDGTFVNEKIISKGYGHEYTYHIPYKRQTEFKNAERVARESKKGLWSPNACVE